jgi:formylmethanofuran dehydrogenase subunit E
MELTMDVVEQAKAFHGHFCPGLVMGIRAAQVALEEIGPHSADEEVVAIVETDMCAVDAIQVMTGCTFGKGNLIHLDYGKNAFTFIRRSDGKAIRIVSRPNDVFQRNPEQQALFEKINSGQATEEEKALFQEQHQARARAMLSMPIEDLYEIQRVDAIIPARARLHNSVKCAGCGETVMETRAHIFRGEIFCTPCFEMRDRRYPS